MATHLTSLEEKFRLLIKRVRTLHEQKTTLEKELSEKDKEIEEQKEKLKELEEKMEAITTASSTGLDQIDGAFREKTKETITTFIKEIDSCIARLNQ